MKDVLVWITVVSASCRLVLECEAGMALDGKLFSQDQPSLVIVRCWFSVGTFRGQAIQQSRKRYTDFQHEQLLSQVGETGPVINLYRRDMTTVSGNLSIGISFHMPRAGCQDAGLYTCTFSSIRLFQNRLIAARTEQHEELDLYPNTVRCLGYPRSVDFDDLPTPPLVIKVRCEAITTLSQGNWSWEIREGETWVPIAEELFTDRVWPANMRCRHPRYSILTYIVRQTDRNRQFRVYLAHRSGRSRLSYFTLKDKTSRSPEDSDPVATITEALRAAGWVLFSMVILIIMILIMEHIIYPAMMRALGIAPPDQTTSGASRTAHNADPGLAGQRQHRRDHHRNADGAAPGGRGREERASPRRDSSVDPAVLGSPSPNMAAPADPTNAQVSLEITDDCGAEGASVDSVSQFPACLVPVSDQPDNDEDDHGVLDEAEAGSEHRETAGQDGEPPGRSGLKTRHGKTPGDLTATEGTSGVSSAASNKAQTPAGNVTEDLRKK